METIRVSLLDVDFVNDIIYYNSDIAADLISARAGGKKIKLDPLLKERFIERVLDPFWHSSKDKLDNFSYFSNGQYTCQRSKLKHDFSNDVSYWSTYQFTGASQQQADELHKKFLDFYQALQHVREEQVVEKIKEIDDSVIYWEQRYFKARRQKNDLLDQSDWRVLPDVVDTFEGEKDMWIAWRSYIRNSVLKHPSEFENNLAYFRYTYDIKYPVDPKIYRKLYPNGLLEDGVTPAPAFMDENDPNQWVKHDVAASSDFQRSREISMYNFSGEYKSQIRKVKKSIFDIMKLLNVEDVVPVDWSLYYVSEEG